MTAQQQGVITTSPDGTRRPHRTRTTILAVMCLVILVALFIGYSASDIARAQHTREAVEAGEL